MNKDELLEEYRKIKLEEELNKAMWKKYKPIKVEITYSPFKSHEIMLPVDAGRFDEFIKRELNELGNNENASEKEKLKSESDDFFFGGLNSTRAIDYKAYSQIYDVVMPIIDDMYGRRGRNLDGRE